MKICVKWNKGKYEVDVDVNDSLETLHAQLYALTRVPVARQKLLGVKKSNTVSSVDMSIKDAGIKKAGQTIMLMGTAEDVDVSQIDVVPETVHAEEEQQEEQPKMIVPLGLENLGNTCYMNATLQALHSIPEMPAVLNKGSGNAVGAGMQMVFKMLGDQERKDAVNPGLFLAMFKSLFPQFAETGAQGMPMQQDAEEAWSQLVNSLCNGNEDMKHLFYGKQQVTLTCAEDAEDKQSTEEDFCKLNCHITRETNLLHHGLENGLHGTIEKNSESLGRNATYNREARITKLPPYLTVQFVRFYWRSDTQKKAKILRMVKFPKELDVYNFCSDDLQTALKKTRDRWEANREADLQKKSPELAIDAGGDTPIPDANNGDASDAAPAEPQPLGRYELQAVVGHQGREADSGHYMAWVRDRVDPEQWWKFDDTRVTAVKYTDVEQLCGGADSPLAYILLYRSLDF